MECSFFFDRWEDAVAVALPCAFAGRAGEPLAEKSESAAITRTIFTFRHTGECAENPEQFQCSPMPFSLLVPLKMRVCLIM